MSSKSFFSYICNFKSNGKTIAERHINLLYNFNFIYKILLSAEPTAHHENEDENEYKN
jgi:hypothetical protein